MEFSEIVEVLSDIKSHIPTQESVIKRANKLLVAANIAQRF